MFGDFDDPGSEVSKVVREREGYQLMPELGYNPTNHYLPPRKHKPIPISMGADKTGLGGKLKQFVNRMVKR
jgi:hypothetical protein